MCVLSCKIFFSQFSFLSWHVQAISLGPIPDCSSKMRDCLFHLHIKIKLIPSSAIDETMKGKLVQLSQKFAKSGKDLNTPLFAITVAVEGTSATHHSISYNESQHAVLAAIGPPVSWAAGVHSTAAALHSVCKQGNFQTSFRVGTLFETPSR